jgi:hypothetical protein
MKLFSFLGNAQFFIFVVPLIYWCIDAKAGIKLGLFLMVNGGINDTLKVAFHGPRPYWYSAKVKALSSEITFGIPSGHAQNAVVVWGVLATWLQRKWISVAAVAMILLISLSRLYLGVHFPTDVLAGWLVGILLLWGFIRLEGKVESWFRRHTLIQQILTVLAISLALILLGIATRLSLGNWVMPQQWLANATRLGSEPPNPLESADLIANAGSFFGLTAGALWLARRGGFNAREGNPWQLTTRFLLGLVGVAVIWFGLGIVFPHDESLWGTILSYLRYTLMGVWVTGIAPLIFIRLRLAEPNMK